MEVSQIYELVNSATSEMLGEQALLQEDLSNIVDVGTAVFNADAVDNYVKKLVDRIGKTVFVNRPYMGICPSVLMDDWEWGSVMMKARAEVPDAEESEEWQLEDGVSVDPNIVTLPVVTVKFFNSKTTFTIPVTITELQIKESFLSAEQMNSFLTMITNACEKSMEIKLDALVLRTIDNYLAETYYDYANNSATTRCYFLMDEYNTLFSKSLTNADYRDADFLRYATERMGIVKDRMRASSRLFNMGGKENHTTEDRLHTVLLTDFVKACESNLYSDTFHDEYVKAPNADTVPYWQGSGTDYGFTSTSKINVVTGSDHTVELDGIVGCMFDRDALGVCNRNRRTKSNTNARGEFTNLWFKADGEYFNDFDENFVMFALTAPVSNGE